MIINITDLAKAAFNNMFRSYNVNSKYIRVYLKEIAWYGPVFNVTLDEPTSNDKVFDIDQYKIVINKDLGTKFSIINIYYKSTRSYGDFYITTDLIWKDEYHYKEWSKPW